MYPRVPSLDAAHQFSLSIWITRVLNVVDDYSRECVGQLVDTSISGARLVRFLTELDRPLPNTIVCEGLPHEVYWVQKGQPVFEG